MIDLRIATAGVVSLVWLGVAAGCGSGDDGKTLTKEEAAKIGKADWPKDYCEKNGWYGDGVCDSFCPKPDPDCGRDPSCDDGTVPVCMSMPPTCKDGTILAYQNGCHRCVDPETCEPK